MTTLTHLRELPRLSELYPKALARTVRQRACGEQVRDGVLPDVELEAGGIRAQPAKLAAYQRLIGEPLTDTLPAGYVHVLSFPLSVAIMNLPSFPLSLFGLVHLSNRVDYFSPLRLGEAFSIGSRIVNLRAHRRGVQMDAVAEARMGYDVMWRGVSTYLAKGATLPSGIEPVSDSANRPHLEPPALPTATWRLPADLGRKYAAVSGDANPIHLTSMTARILGFKRPIVHGMYSAARALAAVGAARGDSYAWNVVFAAPVYLPATVAFAVKAVDGEGTGHASSGFEYAGWNPTNERVHFTGSVAPLTMTKA